MSENCNHDCSQCASKGNCTQQQKQDLLEKPHKDSKINKIYAIVSGKGGVGKSMVTSLLAVASQRKNKATAILDADITGPSIPKAFGLTQQATGNEKEIFPVSTPTGIKVMSLNLLTQDQTQPVIWRGPLIAGMVKQFWTDVVWGKIDNMFIDMPPGTGDVPLTVFQSVPICGVIIVATPQELVGMIVEKALNMAKMMNIPVIALVENMSYALCPDCQKPFYLFGESHIEQIAKKYGVAKTLRIPIDPLLAKACDGGDIENFGARWLNDLGDLVEG